MTRSAKAFVRFFKSTSFLSDSLPILSPLPFHPSSFTLHPSEQLPLPGRLDQPILLVEDALHELLLFFTVRKDLADRLGDEPEGMVIGVATPIEELRHALW